MPVLHISYKSGWTNTELFDSMGELMEDLQSRVDDNAHEASVENFTILPD